MPRPPESSVPDIYNDRPIPTTAQGNRKLVPISDWSDFRIRVKIDQPCVVFARFADANGRRYNRSRPTMDADPIIADEEVVLDCVGEHLGEYFLIFGFESLTQVANGFVTISGIPIN